MEAILVVILATATIVTMYFAKSYTQFNKMLVGALAFVTVMTVGTQAYKSYVQDLVIANLNGVVEQQAKIIEASKITIGAYEVHRIQIEETLEKANFNCPSVASYNSTYWSNASDNKEYCPPTGQSAHNVLYWQ